MKHIQFNLSGDSRPYIEGLEQYEGSFFHNQYAQCLSLVDSYIKSSKSSISVNPTLQNSIDYNNNIIAFDGERGSGKTSCMLSVANILTSNKHERFIEQFPHLSKSSFTTITMIDPSFFDKDHNILSLFTARLYQDFLEKESKPQNKNGNNPYRTELVENFITVQKNLSCIFSSKENKDGLEYLVNLAASVEIKKNLVNLVDTYLKYIGQEQSYLLLLVDDIDIDDTHAYEMAEQIRKYFIQPRIIVLISLKIQQLTGIIRRNLIREYQTEKGRIKSDTEQEIIDRAERYLTKLLPTHQRIFMPQSTEYFNAELIINDAKNWDYHLVKGLQIQQVIPELIFNKTRYLFYNSPNKVSYIVPRNLRNLRQLLKLLVQLPDYNGTPYNKELFCRYFYNDWSDIHIVNEYKPYIKKILKASNAYGMNHEVIMILRDLATDIHRIDFKTNLEVDRIVNPQNNANNVSLGDVLLVIQFLEKKITSEDFKKLTFFIKSYYSIQLYERFLSCYNENTKPPVLTQEDTHLTILKSGHPIVKNEFEAIAGGCFFNLQSGNRTTSEAKLAIHLDTLKDLAKECNQNLDTAKKNGLVNLVEFFMLFSYYDQALEVYASDSTNSFRNSENLCYDFMNEDTRLLHFDLGCFFFNLTRFHDCIDRFSVFPEFNDFIKQDRESNKGLESIIYGLLNYQPSEGNHISEKDRLYSLRNIEILEDFIDGLKISEESIKKNPDKELHNLFVTLSKYKIETYDRNKTGKNTEPYKINFNFLEFFADLFSSPTTEFEEWLKKILEQADTTQDRNKTETRQSLDDDRDTQATKPDQDPIGASAAQR